MCCRVLPSISVEEQIMKALNRAALNGEQRSLSSTAMAVSEQQVFLDDEFVDRNKAMLGDVQRRHNEIDIFERKTASLEKTIEDQRAEEKEKSLKKTIEQLEKECSGLRKCNQERSSALNQKQSELDKKRQELQSLQNTIKCKNECLRKYNETLRIEKEVKSHKEKQSKQDEEIQQFEKEKQSQW
ncbi:hypothetical protein MAR_026141 [Mya arenaria]|uniref:Uncharacterized protein n=1 Tax=Mya arenaria TaxID=6604 RepID=A0ABY7ETB9_MYAAR|nr:hypothetical protein MAR_026141 [Mya arenaria]